MFTANAVMEIVGSSYFQSICETHIYLEVHLSFDLIRNRFTYVSCFRYVYKPDNNLGNLIRVLCNFSCNVQNYVLQFLQILIVCFVSTGAFSAHHPANDLFISPIQHPPSRASNASDLFQVAGQK